MQEDLLAAVSLHLHKRNQLVNVSGGFSGGFPRNRPYIRVIPLYTVSSGALDYSHLSVFLICLLVSPSTRRVKEVVNNLSEESLGLSYGVISYQKVTGGLTGGYAFFTGGYALKTPLMHHLATRWRHVGINALHVASGVLRDLF